jgi:hypothetical protein
VLDKKFYMRAIALAAAFSFTGLASAAQAQSRCAATNRNAGTLPYIQLAEPALAASRPQETFTPAVNRGASRGYTRLIIDFEPCPGHRDYSLEGRNAFKRFFVGKVADKVLTVKAEVAPTDVAATLSLAKIARDSTKKGDVWTTEISNERLLLPYFRVDNNSNVKLTFEFSSNRELKYSGAGDALDIISRAAATINPATALITEENKGRFNDAATFVDRSLSELMKIAITERLTKDVQMSGNDPVELARVTLYAPDANTALGRNTKPMGQWVVSAARVVPSIFRQIDPATGATGRGSSAAAIMNFRVADNKTLLDALSGKESVSVARDNLMKAANAAAQAEPAARLCRVIAIEADRIGLSPTDVGLTLWAYVNNQISDAGKRSVMDTACAQLEDYATAA